MSPTETTPLQEQPVLSEETRPNEPENLPRVVPNTVAETTVPKKKTNHGSLLQKIGAPANKLANSLGSQEFWPMSLDKESEKAARILKSFTFEAVYTEPAQCDRDAPPAYEAASKGKGKAAPALVKIPQAVIKNAVGLAIFSAIRAGFHASLTTGSGVLIARLPDGSWSPPSGILIHSMGVGINRGIDIYDCVVVINNLKALEAFGKLRASLTGKLSVAIGPLSGGGMLDADFRRGGDGTPLYMYMRHRGLYLSLSVNGSIISERTDENARFYGKRITAGDILAGRVKNDTEGTRGLQAAIKDAEGMERNETALEDLNHPLSTARGTDDSNTGSITQEMTVQSQDPTLTFSGDKKTPYMLGQTTRIANSAQMEEYYNNTDDYVEVSGRAPDMDPEYWTVPGLAPPRYQ